MGISGAGSILICAAVDSELSRLCRKLDHPRESEVGGRRSRYGTLSGHPVRLLLTGPGPVNAVQALTAAVEQTRPSLIVQTGCGGAFDGWGLEMGDIAIATCEIDAHLGLSPDNPGELPRPLPFAVLETETISLKNRYPLDPKWTRFAGQAVRAGLPAEIQVVKGPFLTVSTITGTPRRAARLAKEFNACIEAMEGAGAAHLALHYGIPFLEIRAVSNPVGRREGWNLELAFARSNQAVFALMQAFTKKPQGAL